MLKDVEAFWVYILYSGKLGKYYVGQTKTVSKRINYHNSEKNKIRTKRGQPWILKICFKVPDRKISAKLEKHIKKLKSPLIIKKIISSGILICENKEWAADPDFSG